MSDALDFVHDVDGIVAKDLVGTTKDEIDNLWLALPGNETVNIFYIDPVIEEIKEEIKDMRLRKLMFEDDDNTEFLKGIDTLERILG